MNNEIIIILIIFFILIIRKNKEHWGSVGNWVSHAAHTVSHAVIEPTAKFIGDNTIKGLCYMPGVKQMSNELLKRTAESRWNNRLKIIPCDKKDEMVNDAAEIGTWIAPGRAGHAAHAAHVAYEQQIRKCHMLKGNCKRGPRQGPYPNNQSAQLIHQNYICNWNEGTKRCNCCSNGNCKNVNNYMLGYEVIRPPSEHARMC